MKCFSQLYAVLWFLICLFPGLTYAQEQESLYPVKPVYPPELVRPEAKTSVQALSAGATGQLPAYDGEFFRINLKPEAGEQASAQGAQDVLGMVLNAIGWTRNREELKAVEPVSSPQANQQSIDAEIKRGDEETRKRLQGEYGKITPATEEAISEQKEEARNLAATQTTIYRYVQHHQGVPFDNTALQVIWRSGMGFAAVTGRVFNEVKLTNSRRLSAADAQKSAENHISQFTDVSGAPQPQPELVIFPYAHGFKYAWRMDITAAEGPYRVWVDAQNGSILQLDPQYFFDGGQGLVFNPDPTTGTVVKTFEVDPPSGGSYRLSLNGVLDVNNNGADGTCTGDLTISDPGTGEANFNVNPINGTAVNRTSDANYNCRFQEVNVYGWVYDNIQTITNSLGGQPLPAITATVNHNNPCGFGINNACANSINFTLTFGIGSATTGASTSCNALFNSAIDATVVTHEFGHLVNANQYSVSSGTMTGAINEGLADFWAYTLHNTNTMGAWWSLNCPAPVQSSFVPRQAEALDVFPEHRVNFGDGFPHSDGQIIAWALWNTRQELLDISSLGTFNINSNLITAMTTAGVGVTAGSTFRRVHDSYLDLLQQLAPLYATSRNIHKVLTGFARAGIFLSDADAVIDINDDFLNRNDAAGPTFSVWTGRDYTFNADGSVNTATQPFNTRFTLEVANDEAFTVNLISSGVQTGVVAGAGGVGSWTIPTADWTTLKAQDQIFYRVTTTNNSGGNVRTSGNPGNGFLAGVPAGRATINESGECECACGASAATPRGGVAAVTLFPVFFALFWLRRLKKKENRES